MNLLRWLTGKKGPPVTRQMIDSAFPLKTQPKPLADIVLIYAGGDTPHPWTADEIKAQPNRYRWPCWVRSNPQAVNVATDASAFATWLHAHNVPKGTAVILDLETAVDGPYVTAFNLALRAAGYKTTKYGSRSTIWKNPKTDGGTFVAWPGHPNEMDHTGDTVAVQYQFHGDYDKSIVLGDKALPLWDTKPPGPQPFPSGRHVVSDNPGTMQALAKLQGCHVDDIWFTTAAALAAGGLKRFDSLEAQYLNAGKWDDRMPAGMVLWLP